LDPAIRHTVVHHSSTSTYIPNFIEIEETFCGRTDGRTDGHFPPVILLGRLLEVDLTRKSYALFSLGFLETIPSPWLGFLRGVFLANNLASSTDRTHTNEK